MNEISTIKPMTPIEGISPGSRMDYALRYARAGFKVLPLHWINNGRCSCGDGECRSPGKHPIVDSQLKFTGGVHSATNDPAMLRQVFGAYPESNIGLAIPDGLIAVDIDPRNGGDITIDELTAQYGSMPDTVMQLTGGGGQHYLYRIPPGMKVAGKLGVGVDVKAAGGYIVAEPSTHASGTAYVWEASSDPLDGVLPIEAPAWIMNRLAAGEASGSRIEQGLRYGVDEKVVSELRSALTHMNVTNRQLADDRDMWVRVGMACKSIGEAGYALWEEWSCASSKFNPEDQWRKWQTFNPQSISYRTIFALAQREGWRNPLTKAAVSSVSGDGYDANTANMPNTPNTERRGFRFDDVSELVTDIKPIQWRVRDYLEDEALILIYGPPGSAKSFMTVDLAACVATGQAWQGHAVKSGPVFYIAGEGHNGLARRFRAWEVEHDMRLPKSMLYKSAGAVSLLEPESIEAVAQSIWQLTGEGANTPALIVIDTLARNFGPGDENSTSDMNSAIAAIDRFLLQPFKCSVLLVHHSGHNMDRARGSSALKGAIDAEHEITRDDAGNVKLRTTKMKDAEIPAEKLLKLRSVELPGVVDEDGNIATSAVLEACEDDLASKVLGSGKDKQPIKVRDVLAALARGWMPYSELEHQLACGRTVAQKAVKKCVELGVLVAGPTGGYLVSEKGTAILSQTGAFLTGTRPAARSSRPWEENNQGGE